MKFFNKMMNLFRKATPEPVNVAPAEAMHNHGFRKTTARIRYPGKWGGLGVKQWRWLPKRPSKYMPHQGAQECERRAMRGRGR